MLSLKTMSTFAAVSAQPCGATAANLDKKGKYQSGQMGQTVNLLAYAFGGSNPSLPTLMREIPES